jgi:hypothetical protein
VALRRLERLRPRQSEQRERRIDGGDGPRDRVGEIQVARRHVVQRAVWLHVREPNALRSSNGGQSANLIRDEIFHFAWCRFHLTATEPDEIRKSRMSSNRRSMFTRQRDRSSHHARDRRRGNRRQC